MGILLAFSPFLVFAVLDKLVGPTEGLIAGAAVSALLIFRDRVLSGKTAKILEIGTVLLFGGLAIHVTLGDAAWSVVGVRLCVDAGLLAIVLFSIAIRRPFTLQYAREQVPSEFWSEPEFIRTNNIISAVWALAFFVLVLADLLLLHEPDLSPRYGIAATIAALVAAVKFTSWYPERKAARS